MSILETLREKLKGSSFEQREIDFLLEQYGFYQLETENSIVEDSDEDEKESRNTEDHDEESVIKYSNGKSQIWVKYIMDAEDLNNDRIFVTEVTKCNKKLGSTKVRAFRTTEEIKAMMDYFRRNNMNEYFMVFIFGIMLARRVGDIFSLKWCDFYEENGRKKKRLTTLVEQKTGKTVPLGISDMLWKYIDWYCQTENINPMEHFSEDIFPSLEKNVLRRNGNRSKEKYETACRKQASNFRVYFKRAAQECGIDGVSTHSMRKTFGYMTHKINQFDPDCLPVLQSIYGHESVETTKIYIDIMDEKAENYFNGIGNLVGDIDNGNTTVFDNPLMIAMRTEDLREMVMIAIKEGKKSADDMELFNQIMNTIERKRIAC